MTILFIISATILTAITLAFILFPLLRTNKLTGMTTSIELGNLYTQKIEEMKLDLDSGLISEDEYQHALMELKQALLNDSDNFTSSDEPSLPDYGSKRSLFSAIVLIVLVPLVTIGIYSMIGGGLNSVTEVANARPTDENTRHPGMDQAGDISEMVQSLKHRLENNPDDPDGWALLIRSYSYLKQPEQVKLMLAKANSYGFNIALPENEILDSGSTSKASETGIEKLKKFADQNPGNADAWSRLGHAYQQERQFQMAANSFAQALTIKNDNVDLLADFADVLAMTQNRSLQGKPLDLIHQALAINPHHVKSLWLAATAALETGDKEIAKMYWKRLLRELPADSKDRKVIEANLSELEENAPSDIKNNEGSSPWGVNIRGTISVSPDLSNEKIRPSDTVFIFAQAANGPRMPLAVIRKQAKELPFSFTLDDSMAMRPDLKLSDFTQVIVTAKLSKSGNALSSDSYLKASSGIISIKDQAIIDLVFHKVDNTE